ncbi:hypothetical protein FJK98_02300 [Micromonospora sp. HM134]|uniref:hypothetical protein n=1 Tax=Micromonospora sp. HM134 TaxID=2583243 RepID=UPI0011988E12|nr:hypothetical protein [Micromonospora sp. HM134]QDY06136.1 hypothetical protein FJK98_02300 [Micromonospora sp. HM134]
MTGELPADLGPCRWCGDPQWRHKRGKAGCQEPECGCDKYLPPKSPPTKPEPTCAYPNGEDGGEHDHAMCEDVVAERAELAGVVESDPASPVPGVADVRPDGPDLGVQVAGFEPARPDDVDLEPLPERGVDPAADLREADAALRITEAEVDRLHGELRRLEVELGRARGEADRMAQSVIGACQERDLARREHDGAIVQRDQAYERVEELDVELGRIRGALGVDVDVDLADAARDRVAAVMRLSAQLACRTDEVEQLRGALTRAKGGWDVGTLWRYDARQCETCGFRTTVPGLRHEHPLVPVTVLVVRREVVPGA